MSWIPPPPYIISRNHHRHCNWDPANPGIETFMLHKRTKKTWNIISLHLKPYQVTPYCSYASPISISVWGSSVCVMMMKTITSFVIFIINGRPPITNTPKKYLAAMLWKIRWCTLRRKNQIDDGRFHYHRAHCVCMCVCVCVCVCVLRETDFRDIIWDGLLKNRAGEWNIWVEGQFKFGENFRRARSMLVKSENFISYIFIIRCGDM